ncbi:hypothetical protein GCM10010246_64600 [Streptomyces cuspidosporus]|uniref:Uncharacterized protein n=1 Tax=Streptomyces cuspidosporus TaxID=66882 RepID=A0ABN3GXM3_9ACTN
MVRSWISAGLRGSARFDGAAPWQAYRRGGGWQVRARLLDGPGPWATARTTAQGPGPDRVVRAGALVCGVTAEVFAEGISGGRGRW